MSPTRSVLASGDSEELISLLIANPNLDTVTRLVDSFEELSKENPDKADLYASTLVAARDSGKIPKIEVGEPNESQQDDFAVVLNRFVYNTLTSLLYEKSEHTIQANNSYIVASIISGIAIRTTLCFSSAQIGEITRGLHFPRSDYKSYWGPERYEINAVGACVAIITGGKAIYTGELIEEPQLKESLRAIEEHIKDPIGRKILEIAKQQVDTQFAEPFVLTKFYNTLKS